jgi:hypothetical protein
MDKKTRIRLGYDKYESQKIHEELFQKTSEYEYLLYGIAQGMYSIYLMLHSVGDKYNFTNNEMMDLIKDCANKDEKIKDAFDRLLLDLEN